MAKKKYLHLYKEWMEKGEISDMGLCNCFGSPFRGKYQPLFELMRPTTENLLDIIDEGKDEVLWGADKPRFSPGDFKGFTPLRQTIVLFMAAINGEL